MKTEIATFIAIAMLMMAAALLCVLPSLLQPREAGGPAQWRTALALVLALPAAATLTYLQVGRPEALAVPAALLDAAAVPADHGMSEAAIPAMVERLAQRLRTQPGDTDGWTMLAQSYGAMGRYREAADAYAHLAQLLPQDAGVLADYADALATAQDGSLAGEPERLVQRALALDPRQVKALALSASAAFARGDFALAERQWQTVLPLVPADSKFARSTQAAIGEARARRNAGTTKTQP